MKKHTLFIPVLLFSFSLFSQTIISPNFRLGDTSQILALTTYRGDRFIGKLIKWQADTIYFSIKKSASMRLPFSSIKSIWETGDSALPPVVGQNTGIFTIVTEDNTKALRGRLKILDKRQVKFHPDDKGLQFFKLKEIQQIIFTPNASGHPNNFNLKIEGEKDREVQFISFKNGMLTVRENGIEKKYEQKGQLRLYYLKPRQSMNGHQRQLLMSPTGFNLKAKETIYRNSMFAHSEFAHGFSDYFSVAVGGEGFLPFISGRLSFSPHRLLHFSAGAMWLPAEERFSRAWHLAATFGTPDYFLNIARVKYIGDLYFEFNDFQATTLGASFRIGKRSSIYSEYVMADQIPLSFFSTLEGRLNLFSWGFRWFGKNNSVSVGLMAYGPQATFCPGCSREVYRPIPAFAAEISLFKNKEKKGYN